MKYVVLAGFQTSRIMLSTDRKHMYVTRKYRVSHLIWNTPPQHSAAAPSEMPGNDLVTRQKIAVASKHVDAYYRWAPCTYIKEAFPCTVQDNTYVRIISGNKRYVSWLRVFSKTR